MHIEFDIPEDRFLIIAAEVLVYWLHLHGYVWFVQHLSLWLRCYIFNLKSHLKINSWKYQIFSILAQWEHNCYEVQDISTLSEKILTEKEKFRLEYSENPDFLKLKTRSSELIQILLLSTLHLVTAMLPLGLIERK